MSNTEKSKPLTMSAERMAQIVKLAYGYEDRAMFEILKELDARELAHAETREHLVEAQEQKLSIGRVATTAITERDALREQLEQARANLYEGRRGQKRLLVGRIRGG